MLAAFNRAAVRSTKQATIALRPRAERGGKPLFISCAIVGLHENGQEL